MNRCYTDPDWYRIKYNIAALHANQSAELAQAGLRWSRLKADSDRDTKAEAAELRELAHSLASDLAQAGLEQSVEHREEVAPDLLAFLEEAMVPAALVLAIANAEERDPGLQAVRFSQDPIELEPPGGEAGTGGPTPEMLLGGLRRNGLDAELAFDYLVEAPVLAPRVHYNLACLFTAWGEYEPAVNYMDRAIGAASRRNRPRLARLALTDPTLTPLVEEMAPLKERLEGLAP